MPEFARTIVARLRQYVSDRRQSKRQSVRLDLSLSLAAATKSLNGSRRVSTMNGHTVDLSANGLALIVPQITLGEHHLVGENRFLNLKLQLPDGPVEFQAVPVRYQRLEEHEHQTGYLIAMKIVRMSDGDRVKYSEYFASLWEKRNK
ncbi:MAG: PilZ domain-containing protein [bacterium]